MWLHDLYQVAEDLESSLSTFIGAVTFITFACEFSGLLIMSSIAFLCFQAFQFHIFYILHLW